LLWGKSPEESIESAFALEKTQEVSKAYEIMKKAKKDYPKNPDVLSVYGYMAGLEAQTTYMFRAAMLASSAISAFDDALEIEQEHKNARLWRGILKINMPSFLGKVPAGILDLEEIQLRDDLTEEEFIMTKFFLGMGYGKAERYDEAISSFNEVIALNKADLYEKESKMRIERILQEKKEKREKNLQN
jgi:tetratricopeptide (TPR) repeat protein